MDCAWLKCSWTNQHEGFPEWLGHCSTVFFFFLMLVMIRSTVDDTFRNKLTNGQVGEASWSTKSSAYQQLQRVQLHIHNQHTREFHGSFSSISQVSHDEFYHLPCPSFHPQLFGIRCPFQALRSWKHQLQQRPGRLCKSRALGRRGKSPWLFQDANDLMTGWFGGYSHDLGNLYIDDSEVGLEA